MTIEPSPAKPETVESMINRLRDHENEGVTSSDRFHLRNEAADALEALAPSQAVEEMRRDAERYRWLQNNECGRRNWHNGDTEQCYLDLNPRDLDAAIDSAIAKGTT